MAYIRYNPHEPGDCERACGESFVGSIVLWGSVCSIIYYIYSLVLLFKGKYSENTLYSLGFLIVMAMIDFFAVSSKINKEQKKTFAKKFFLFFVGGTLDISAIIGVIIALCHTDNANVLLISALLCILCVTISVILIYRKIEGYESVRLYADKKLLEEINQSTISSLSNSNSSARRSIELDSSITETPKDIEKECFFCHKCGRKVLADSVFCSSCGTKLKQ